jgi:TolB protein
LEISRTGGIFVILLLLSGSLTESLHDFPIVTDPFDQSAPAIYQDIVVWEDKRNGNSDIYGYDLATKEEFQITQNTSSQSAPEIYQDMVVWQDLRNGNYDIYGYNLATKEEFQITEDSSDQFFPTIYQDIVVWEDCRNRNKDIYGLNLATHEEFPIVTEAGDQRFPIIYQDIVIWNTFPKTSDGGECNRPGFLMDKEIHWLSTNQEEYGLSGYNVTTSHKFHMAKKGVTSSSAFHKNIVVWSDSRNVENIHSKSANCDIFGHNLTTRREISIATNSSWQCYPAVYRDITVWVDRRNDNNDIYGCDISAISAGASSYPYPLSSYLLAIAIVVILIVCIWMITQVRKQSRYTLDSRVYLFNDVHLSKVKHNKGSVCHHGREQAPCIEY